MQKHFLEFLREISLNSRKKLREEEKTFQPSTKKEEKKEDVTKMAANTESKTATHRKERKKERKKALFRERWRRRKNPFTRSIKFLCRKRPTNAERAIPPPRTVAQSWYYKVFHRYTSVQEYVKACL